MDSVRNTTITKDTAISLGLMLAIAGAIFYAGYFAKTINSHEVRITTVEAKVNEMPTKVEIQDLTKTVDSLSRSIKTYGNTKQE